MIHDLACDNAVVAVVATDSPYRPAAAAKTTAAGHAVDEAGFVHEFSHAAIAAQGTQRVVHGLRRLRHPEGIMNGSAPGESPGPFH
ncbi:hypothetical protein M2163_002731 [Streptomyces sp. SAI-135]|jgi:hypothetical protein|uniref:hypothetical protein n=1 Tax=unclassified Streptomyces TaxID=2593676 RepID=UPI002473E833|nr:MULTISPECIES: hypothetical protein [unclassified Streptomyces]MDH6520287.1 hypothetical protein [Streptomyces sp. SAI-090]MDH6571589.1 hypothetical protein [Streptomyces sp. SAI-117]MDH6583449.1 hypothetical protein [Streptomyces sp. SAI-133]MDH6615623.1 hypothetical protein [Streptomyces sp. SAI-135]